MSAKAEHVIRVERVLDAERARVFEILDDFERYPEWNPFTTRVLTNRVVGEEIVLHVDMPGARSRVMKERMTAYEPGRKMAWGLRWGFGLLLSCDRVQELEALPDGRTRYVCYEGFEGVLAPLVVRLYGESMQRGFESVAHALEKRVGSLR